MRKEGLLVKGVGGFYDVMIEDAAIRRCKARGNIKKNLPGGLLVGDRVIIDENFKDEYGIVESVKKRKNVFIRPPVANVDLFFVVISIKEPKISFSMIDRFLAMTEKSGTEAILCINKADLCRSSEIEEIVNTYSPIYDIIINSTHNEDCHFHIEKIRQKIRGRTAAFSGPSGVGKSTIINALKPELNLRTDRISEKTKRGRHTTRHVEIFEINGGYVFDTPGFTNLNFFIEEETDVEALFPEIRYEASGCRFSDCRHINEPDCAVIEAVCSGKIRESRYESYRRALKEVEEEKNRGKDRKVENNR